jgi:hypothetical protein
MTSEIAFLNHLRRVGNKVYDHAFPFYARVIVALRRTLIVRSGSF